MLHDEPSASKFSEERFSIFRTEDENEDENEDEKMGRWDCRGSPPVPERSGPRAEPRGGRPFIIFRGISGFRPDRRVFLHIPEVLQSECDYFLPPSMLVPMQVVKQFFDPISYIRV